MALVGASGAGKSTLIHLLLGFIRPTSGRILIDGVPLERLNPEAWRRLTAWVAQRPMLFSGSIKENIALARPEVEDQHIEAAARQAGVMAFAAQKERRLDTEVGEQGKNLSMGQAQRVALARAFLTDAPLLLLDEPTASLDTATESAILADLRRWSRGRTMLMATHRPAPLALADRIMILKQGRLVAQGSYAELAETHAELLPDKYAPPQEPIS